MATFYRCDRCNSEHTRPLNYLSLPYPKQEWRNEQDTKNFELCDNCIENVRSYLTHPNATVVVNSVKVREALDLG